MEKLTYNQLKGINGGDFTIISKDPNVVIAAPIFSTHKLAVEYDNLYFSGLDTKVVHMR